MVMEHWDDKNSGALWWQGPWSIVMTRNLEHCDDKGHGALWWHGHGTLWWQKIWSIVMTMAMEHCDDMVMEHCDDKNSGALWWQVSWSIVMKGFIVHCGDKGDAVLWWNRRLNCSVILNIKYGSTVGLNVKLQRSATLQSAAPARTPNRRQGRRPGTGHSDLIDRKSVV